MPHGYAAGLPWVMPKSCREGAKKATAFVKNVDRYMPVEAVGPVEREKGYHLATTAVCRSRYWAARLRRAI